MIISPEKTQFIHLPTPHPPPPMLGCTFLSLIEHIFLSSWHLFLQKVAKMWNFWKVAINRFAVVWTHYEFHLVFHAANTMCCAVVLSDSAASLIGYVASTATAKTKLKLKLQAQQQVSKNGQHTFRASFPGTFLQKGCRKPVLGVWGLQFFVT